jgi:hypothetical protein
VVLRSSMVVRRNKSTAVLRSSMVVHLNRSTAVLRSSTLLPHKAMVARRKSTVEVAATRIMSSTTTRVSG